MGGKARLGWEFNFHLEDQQGSASWHYCIDANTGQVLRKRNTDFGATISGDVEGYIFPTDGDDDTSKEIWQNAMVKAWWYNPYVPAWYWDHWDYTEYDGDYSIDYSAPYNTWHFFSVQTSGTKCQVSSVYYGGIPLYNTGAYPYYDLPPTWYPNVDWSDGTYSKLDNNNVFYHVTNALEDYYEDKHDGFNLGFSIIANVHHPGCDAWYDPFYKTINFGIGGVSCRNPARERDIILHELQHAITDEIYGPFPSFPNIFEGAVNEAYSDYFACTITDDPNFGGVRHLDWHYDEGDWVWDPNYTTYFNSLVISHIFWTIRSDPNVGIGQTEADDLIWCSLNHTPNDWQDLYYACCEDCPPPPSDPNIIIAIFKSHVPGFLPSLIPNL